MNDSRQTNFTNASNRVRFKSASQTLFQVKQSKRLFIALFGLLLLLTICPVYAQQLDSTFNPNIGGGSEPLVNAFAVQTDGRILVGGSFTTVGGVTRNNLARLNADGSLDPAFNPNLNGVVNAIAVQTDGRIVVGGGFTTVGGVARSYIARLNADGTLDTAFNQNTNSFILAVALQSDGKILVGGGFTNVGGVGSPRTGIARLNANGTLDTDFNPILNNNYVAALTVQAGGGILVGGIFSTVGGVTRNNLARLNTGGTLDSDFNPNLNGAANAIAVQTDGRIVVGGGFTTAGGVTRNRLARLNANGTLDTAFNPNVNNDVQTLTVQADGRIVIGGNFTAVGGVTRNYLARLNADAALDSAFNPNPSGAVYELMSQTDGRIVVGGYFTTVGGTTRNRIARLNANSSSIQFSASTFTTSEGNQGVTNAVITVTRTGDTSVVNTVNFTTASGTATGGTSCSAGVDFLFVGGTLTFNPGIVSQTLVIPVCGDMTDEPNEPVNIFLSNPNNGAALGSPSTAVLVIVNDDAANCQPKTINFGESFSGVLNQNSCFVGNNATDIYTFTVTDAPPIALTMTSADFYTRIELLNSQGSVIAQAGGDNERDSRLPASGYFALPAAGTYTIRAVAAFGGSGAYILSLFRQPDVACTYSLSPTLTNAPAGDGTYFFDVLTQNGCPPVNAQVSSGSDFIQIVSNSGGRVIFVLTPNTATTARAGSITVGNSLTHTINQYGIAPPSNDSFAAAAPISGASSPPTAPVTGFNTNATAEAGEPAHVANNAAAKSVWYRWTAPTGGLYSFSTSGSSFDTVMAIYECPATGTCSFANMSPFGSNDDTTAYDKTSKLNFRATGGRQYMIAVDGKRNALNPTGESGTIQLAWLQYQRLYRVYLQNFNGNQSPLTPTNLNASDGTTTVLPLRISQGVYEFNLPTPATPNDPPYRVTIGGPEGIFWTPSSFSLDTSFARLDELMQGPAEGGQNTVANANSFFPRIVSGYIKNITSQELATLKVEIASSRGPNPQAAKNCDLTAATIPPSTQYAKYVCQTQPQTVHDIIPTMPGKKFTAAVKSYDTPVSNSEIGLPESAFFVASDAPSYSLGGQVSAGGQGTVVDLSYIPAGSSQAISLRTTTNAAGFYEFKDLSPNTYRVRATRPNFVFNQPADINLTATVTNANITAQECAYDVPAGITPIPNSGGAGQFTVRTNFTICEWSAATSESWITINSGATVGNGPVHFTALPGNGQPRNGIIRVAGKDFTVTQTGNNNPVPVINSLSPATKTAGDAGFELTIAGSSFVSGAKVTFNNGAERTPTAITATEIKVPITAADIAAAGSYPVRVINPTPGGGASNAASLTVNNCAYQITQPAQTNFISAGGSGSISVSTTAGCSWTAAATDYCMMSVGSGGTGSGAINFTVLSNPGVARAATISVAGQTVVINQAAAAGTHRARLDFDGDGKADVSVYRPGNGGWYLLNAQNGFSATQFGIASDQVAAADFDGDGKTDIAVFRPETGVWYWLNSSNGAFSFRQFGQRDDIPQPADFDGDGRAELTVYRPSNGTWYKLNLTNNEFVATRFGAAQDKPLVGDYDGDGKADYAVFRPSDGGWYLQQSTRGFDSHQFGLSADKPAPADFDGNGRTDIAVYRNGIWYVLLNQTTFLQVNFGAPGDVPVPADYNGDKSADIAVYRPSTGIWYVWSCRNNAQLYAVQFGAATDKPVPNGLQP